MSVPSSPVEDEIGQPAQPNSESEVVRSSPEDVQSSPEDLHFTPITNENTSGSVASQEYIPDHCSHFSTEHAAVSREEVTSSSNVYSCTMHHAPQRNQPSGLPPITSFKPDVPPSYQKPPDSHLPDTYFPDFSDLCQENYNFWQPFFDPQPNHCVSANTQNQPTSGTGSNLAELDYLLERAGLYQGCDVLYRNQWEDVGHEMQHQPQMFFSNPGDPMKNIYHSSRSQPPPLVNTSSMSYNNTAFPCQTYSPPVNQALPQTFGPQPPIHSRSHHTNYGEYFYGRDDVANQVSVGPPPSQHIPRCDGYPIKLTTESQPMMPRDPEFSLPPLKIRSHFDKDPPKHVQIQEPVYRPNILPLPPLKQETVAMQQPTAIRPVDSNPLLFCAYPISYSYQNQTKPRNQPILFQVRAPVDKVRPYLGNTSNKRSKTVKEMIELERSYSNLQRVPSQAITATITQPVASTSSQASTSNYWRLPSISESSVSVPCKTTSVGNSMWTFQVPAGSGRSVKQMTMESALAGFPMKPGSTVTSVYPIPGELGNLAFKRPRKEPPKCEALKAVLLGEKPPVLSPANIPPFRTERVNAKLHRPRHYELVRLEIGNFQVNVKSSDVGRKFVNKVKVLFTKRRFVYEFEMQMQKSVQKTMFCIQVPFSSVEAMHCEEDLMRVLVNRRPIMYLGARNHRQGIVGMLTVFDTTQPVDITNGDISTSPLHKITLKKNQAEKLMTYLWHFDDRFRALSQMPIPDHPISKLLPPSYEHEISSALSLANESTKVKLRPSGSEQSTHSPKRTSTRITRAPRRYRQQEEDSDENEGQGSVLMCTCRISCRSVRCSCVKGFRKCNSTAENRCQCSNCDNPLNILEDVGVKPALAAQDDCLTQNVYRIMYLKSYLERSVQLDCCDFVASVRDCIPGTVPCPNPKCSAQLEYSWCRGTVHNALIVRRNHCTICVRCCLKDQRHCLQCNRCFDFGGFRNRCPACGSDNAWPVVSSKSTESAVLQHKSEK